MLYLYFYMQHTSNIWFLEMRSIQVRSAGYLQKRKE